MPIVAGSTLPAIEEVAREGVPTVAPGETTGRVVRVGLLNLMPDAALRATDRQWLRVLAHPDVEVEVRPFTVAAEARGDEARTHIAAHYSTFEEVRRDGLDALVVTGANPARPLLAEEPFWPGLVEVLEWAERETRSVLCSCLATHAVMEHRFGTRRERLPRKMWGWFSHRPTAADPLVEGVEPGLVVPHSRWYDIPAERFTGAGAKVLVYSDEAGTLLATAADGFYVFLQGHIEYDVVSIAKEYQREIDRYLAGEEDALPPYPVAYFPEDAIPALEEHRRLVRAARERGAAPPDTRADEFVDGLQPVWAGAARTLVGNWLAGITAPSRAG
ncbi:MAG: homoserine O-succinyltransferase [Actinomycetes bacterium]|nr:MAG: homoserine O-succinyltransferase [Actinomycetota bacterium]